LPGFAPRIRVEVYVPIRYEPAYQDTLTWLIEEFTELRGGCTVNENVGGYYLSQNNEVIDDRISIVYSDFPMNWDKQADQNEVLNYCAMDTESAATFNRAPTRYCGRRICFQDRGNTDARLRARHKPR
jgi:hypothetical protein